MASRKKKTSLEVPRKRICQKIRRNRDQRNPELALSTSRLHLSLGKHRSNFPIPGLFSPTPTTLAGPPTMGADAFPLSAQPKAFHERSDDIELAACSASRPRPSYKNPMLSGIEELIEDHFHMKLTPVAMHKLGICTLVVSSEGMWQLDELDEAIRYRGGVQG
ncbi:hypothetical protein BJ508DRAFT_307696 [Ascobolus immersus RN42]|uniref:Uncharacterized protein n=1 Tax=Ascobolus immersus RN42 TaxID=1160509 RepID=A0A3N4I7Q2_ASCIM|nr:hypothetical protein BJ508DRAFT_307696 [Ascobolus immersus RN42]